MKFCYQVATSDVAVSPAVTAFQGKLTDSLDCLSEFGYDGVEFMTLDPHRLDWEKIRLELDKRGMMVSLVCTGEIFGQLGLSYMDPIPAKRKEAVRRSKDIVDFAEALNANINIGRIHGVFRHDVKRDDSYKWLLDSLRELCDHAGPKNVLVALENVTIMQTNCMNTVAETLQTAEDVGRDNCRIMMDVFHMNIEEKNLFECIREHGGKTAHVHLSDNNRRYPGNCGMDFERIVQAFKDAGYNAAYTTEIFQLPDQETAAEEAMRHLSPIFKRVYGT